MNEKDKLDNDIISGLSKQGVFRNFMPSCPPGPQQAYSNQVPMPLTLAPQPPNFNQMSNEFSTPKKSASSKRTGGQEAHEGPQPKQLSPAQQQQINYQCMAMYNAGQLHQNQISLPASGSLGNTGCSSQNGHQNMNPIGPFVSQGAAIAFHQTVESQHRQALEHRQAVESLSRDLQQVRSVVEMLRKAVLALENEAKAMKKLYEDLKADTFADLFKNLESTEKAADNNHNNNNN